jgi:hypothetical protein
MNLPLLQIPQFTVKLPSINEDVTLRLMVVREEKILLIAKQSEDRIDILKAIKQVVSNCLQEYDVSKLTLFDLEFLYVKIRAYSASNIIKLSYIDKEDNKTYDFNVDLIKDVTIKKEDNNPKIEFKNGDNLFEIFLKYPSSSLYDDENFLGISDDFFENLVFRCIDKILMNGNVLTTDSFEEFKQWFDTLPITAYDDIKQYFSKLPKLFCEISYTNSVGTERKIVLQSLEDFFMLR